MQRRKIIKYLALGIGSTIALPAWANAWHKDAITNAPKILNANQEAILAELAETIIPQSDIPGAKELGIPQFIQKMVMDCYDKKAQAIFKDGFGMLDDMAKYKWANSFLECSTAQRIESLQLLEKEPDSDLKKFYLLVKGLTVRGFMTSQYVMVNHLKYRLVPGKFQPCMPIEK